MNNNFKVSSLKKFTALCVGGFLSMTATVSALDIDLTVQEFSPTSPYNPNTCVPSSIPTGASGLLNTNSFLPAGIATNPEHKSRLVSIFGSGSILQLDGFGNVGGGVVPVAYTTDRTKHWNYTFIPLAPCVGGSVAAFGGATDIAYNKDGHHVLVVGSYTNILPFQDQEFAYTGHWAAHSDNDGKTWSDAFAFSIAPSSVDLDFEGTSYIGGGATTFDLETHGRCYWLGGTLEYPSTFYGNLTYARSKDHGKTWSQELVVYDMAFDNVWLDQNADFDLEPAPPRIGGQSIPADIISIPGSNSNDPILVAGMLRIYPIPGSTTYTQNIDVPGDSITDHAVIISSDQGRHFTTEAVQIGQFNLGILQDPTQPPVNQALVSDNSLGMSFAYSEKTDRLYAVFQAASVPPTNLNPVPTPDWISVAVSGDKGESWITANKVNLTPTTGPQGSNQAFNANIATIAKGYVAVVYYDFRNYDGSLTNVATDAWVALYRETDSPTGGNTGIGLDFVQEIRLTAQSFNALIGFDSNFDTAAGVPVITSNTDNFFINFSETGTDNLPTSVIPATNVTIDPNNRFNTFSGNLDVDD